MRLSNGMVLPVTPFQPSQFLSGAGVHFANFDVQVSYSTKRGFYLALSPLSSGGGDGGLWSDGHRQQQRPMSSAGSPHSGVHTSPHPCDERVVR